jgi:hypothetical protein
VRRRTLAASLGAAAAAAAAFPVYNSLAADQPRQQQAYTWRNVVVNGGGFVPGIVFNDTEAGLIYARTDIGGLYRWQEDSQTWKPLTDWIGADHYGYTGIASVATDPVEPNRVYAAVGTYTNDWDPNNGAILYSDDYGDTWGVAELPFKLGGNMPGRGMGERLAVDPTDNKTLYLGAPNGNGLQRSTDYGRTWSKVESFPNPGNFVVTPGDPYNGDNQGVLWAEFDPTGGKIFVGVADPDDPLYVSSDGGSTWQPVAGAAEAIGRAGENRTIPKQAAADHASGHLFIATGNDPGPFTSAPSSGRGGEVQRLDIGTGEWTDVTPNYNPADRTPAFGGITVDRQRPGTIMVATLNNWQPDEILYRSTDSGQTWGTSWDKVAKPDGSQGRTDRFDLDHSASPWLTFGNTGDGWNLEVKHGWMIEALAIDPHDSDRIMWGTGATIWGTESLTQWDAQGDLVGEDGSALPIERFTVAVRAQGLEECSFQDVAALGGTLLSAVGDLGGFVHTDLTKAVMMIRKPNWTTGTSVDFAELNPDVLVGTGNVTSEHGHVAVSTDRGATWQPTARVSGVPGDGHGGIVAVTADGSAILWTPGDSEVTPIRSTDLGQTWTAIAGLPAGAKIRADRADAGTVYAYAAGAFYRSTDGGASFSGTGASGLPGGNGVDFRAVFGREGHLWLAGGDGAGGMWRSQDGGSTWTKVAGVDQAQVVGFGKAADGQDYPALYASAMIGGTQGIYRSDDAGGTWSRINDDAHQWAFTNTRVTGDPEVYGRVYIATNGRGLIYGDIG